MPQRKPNYSNMARFQGRSSQPRYNHVGRPNFYNQNQNQNQNQKNKGVANQKTQGSAPWKSDPEFIK